MQFDVLCVGIDKRGRHCGLLPASDPDREATQDYL